MSWLGSIIRPVGVKHCDGCPVHYRFYSRDTKVYQTSIKGIDYTHWEYDGEKKENVKRCQIFIDGAFIVYKDAGSDGCTPCWLVFNWFYFGIFNGFVSGKTKEPITARAFYLHDWLLKIRHICDIPVSEIHNEFCREINLINAWPKRIYCRSVQLFGPKD